MPFAIKSFSSCSREKVWQKLLVKSTERRGQFHQRAALACADPEIVKKTVRLLVVFRLLGSARVKAVPRTLVKSTEMSPSIDLHHHLALKLLFRIVAAGIKLLTNGTESWNWNFRMPEKLWFYYTLLIRFIKHHSI